MLICEIHLYHKDKDDSKISCIINLYYGKNIGYCFLNNKGTNFELLFLAPNTQNLNIKCNNKDDIKICECDDFGIEERKKFIPINFPFDIIYINDKKFDLKKQFPKESISNSFQYSFYNIEKKLVPVQEIKLKEEITSIEELNSSKDSLKKFYNELYTLYSKINISENAHKKEFNLLLKKYNNLNSFNIDFINYEKNYLKNLFSKDEDIEIFYSKALYEIIKIKKNNISKNRKYFENVLSFIETYEKTIIKDENLAIYHKILILKNFFYVFQKTKGIEGFKNLNLKYYILEKSKTDSVFKLTIDFIKYFINKLNISSDK